MTADDVPREWRGLRWQVSFTADGGTPPPPVDASTSAQGRAWAETIVGRLRDAGHDARLDFDEGQDAAGAPAEYAQVRVALGDGYSVLSFFAEEIFWSVDVPANYGEEDAVGVLRDSAAIVSGVTGYMLVTTGLGPLERALHYRA